MRKIPGQQDLKALQENIYIKVVIDEGRETLVSRPIDARWHYHDIIQKSLSGFNPLLLRVFYPQKSCISEFIDLYTSETHRICSSFQNYFETSWLPYEVFYCVHDYIHCRIIAEALSVFPPHFFDFQHSGQHAIYRLAYCLWLSEAAATIGLDYWYLCCPWNRPLEGFHTGFTALTTNYRHSGDKSNQLDQFVQSKEFFRLIFSFYSGHQETSQTEDSSLFANLRTQKWYLREQQQANLFTKLTTTWLARSRGFGEWNDVENSAKHSLVLKDFSDHITDLVWKIFKEHQYDLLRIPSSIENPLNNVRFDKYPFDPRFFDIHQVANWKTLPFDEELNHLTQRQFAYLVAQYVASFDFEHRGYLDAIRFDKVVFGRDLKSLREWASSLEPIKADTNYFADEIVFPN